MSIGIFTVAAKGSLYIFDILKKNFNKNMAFGILALLLLLGVYFQLNHANQIIKAKIDTYAPVKEAALWMKENSLSDDKIATASSTQTSFYSERSIVQFTHKNGPHYNEEEFTMVIKEEKPKYLVISIFEPWVPQWTYNYPQKNQLMFKPVKAWFSDPQQTQPALIIYEIDYQEDSNLNVSQYE
jgi:hypothetical protein